MKLIIRWFLFYDIINALFMGGGFPVDYICKSFRNASVIFENDYRFKALWDEVKGVLDGISDDDIIEAYLEDLHKGKKSISCALNNLIANRLIALDWEKESYIFNDVDYQTCNWRLDFAKKSISIEVGFNHSGMISWNLLKPVLAGELNHVKKAIQTDAGIIITATDMMRKAGNFDPAIGTYEKYIRHLNPLRNMLTVPLVIIGLTEPQTFYIDKKTKSIVEGRYIKG